MFRALSRQPAAKAATAAAGIRFPPLTAAGKPSPQFQSLPLLLAPPRTPLEPRVVTSSATPAAAVPDPTCGHTAMGAFAVRDWLAMDTLADVLRTPVPIFAFAGVYAGYNVAFNWRRTLWDRCAFAEAASFSVYGVIMFALLGTPMMYPLLCPLFVINGTKFAMMVHLLLNKERFLAPPQRHRILLKRLQKNN